MLLHLILIHTRTNSGTAISTCPHCKLPHPQCVEVLYGSQLSHYFKRAAITTGVIYYLEDEDEPEVAIRRNFKKLLTQLKFATAVLNGTRLPTYPDDGTNPFLGNNQVPVELPLPRCVMDGSCAKFEKWLSDQQLVHEWGYEVCPFTEEDDVDYPMAVVNFYRESVERNHTV